MGALHLTDTKDHLQGFLRPDHSLFINNNIRAGPHLHLGPSGKARQLGLRRSVGKAHYSNHRTRPTPNLSAAKTPPIQMLDFKTHKNVSKEMRQYSCQL